MAPRRSDGVSPEARAALDLERRASEARRFGNPSDAEVEREKFFEWWTGAAHPPRSQETEDRVWWGQVGAYALRAIMELKGWTEEDVAVRLNVSRGAVAGWLRDGTLHQLAEVKMRAFWTLTRGG